MMENNKIPLSAYKVAKKSYLIPLGYFERFLQECRLDWGWQALKEWVENMQAQGLAAGTVRVRFFAVKSTMQDWAEDAMTEDERIALSYYLSRIKLVKVAFRNRGVDVPSITEVRRVMRCATPRQSALIEFLVETGIRISECRNARVKDLVKIDRLLYKLRVMGKGSKERMVEIPGRVVERIRSTFNGKTFLLETESGRQYNRWELYKLVRQPFQVHAGQRVSPHLLRHLWGTVMIGRGAPMEAVASYLGHNSIATTAKYYAHNALGTGQGMLNIKRRAYK